MYVNRGNIALNCDARDSSTACHVTRWLLFSGGVLAALNLRRASSATGFHLHNRFTRYRYRSLFLLRPGVSSNRVARIFDSWTSTLAISRYILIDTLRYITDNLTSKRSRRMVLKANAVITNFSWPTYFLFLLFFNYEYLILNSLKYFLYCKQLLIGLKNISYC